MRADEPNPDAAELRYEATLERLDGLVDWEKRARRRAARFSLEPARDLLARLGDPGLGTPFVHVAGSKGKGSVAAIVARALGAAGARVGRYASPHVEDLAERIEIDGRPIERGPLVRALEAALQALEGAREEPGAPAAEATWFDVLTAAAWCAFASAGCDRLVLECGLGGRLDSTNARDGQIAVITNIELEHTEVLGTTRAAIAAEKAGIAVAGGVLVTGVPALGTDGRPDEAGAVLAARAAELGARLVRPAGFDRAAAIERLSLAERNRALARTVLDELRRLGERDRRGRPLSGALVTPMVVDAARLPGRLERLEGPVPIVLDGAHVPASVRAVLRDLRGQPGLARPLVVVLALGRDKDLPGILKALGPVADTLLCTSVGSELFRSPQEIAAAAEELGLVAETVASPRAAFDRALELASPEGWVLAIGSLYLAGELRPLYRTARC